MTYAPEMSLSPDRSTFPELHGFVRAPGQCIPSVRTKGYGVNCERMPNAQKSRAFCGMQDSGKDKQNQTNKMGDYF